MLFSSFHYSYHLFLFSSCSSSSSYSSSISFAPVLFLVFCLLCFALSPSRLHSKCIFPSLHDAPSLYRSLSPSLSVSCFRLDSLALFGSTNTYSSYCTLSQYMSVSPHPSMTPNPVRRRCTVLFFSFSQWMQYLPTAPKRIRAEL